MSSEKQFYQQQANTLKTNGLVLLNERPCKIIECHSTKVGKHGHAKVTLLAIDIFSGKKIEHCFQASANIEVPVIERKEYEYIDEQDGYVILMNTETFETREDIKCEEKIMNQISDLLSKMKTVSVSVQQYGELTKIIEVKELKN